MFDFLSDLPAWWQGLGADVQAIIRLAGLMCTVLLAGHYFGNMTARLLGARHFDEALRLPGSAPPTAETAAGITPTFLAGTLVRLTVWAWAAWWLAGHFGRIDLADRLGLIISRTWAVAGILVVILALASVLARRLAECFQDWRPTPEAAPYRNGAMTPRHNVANAVAVGVYVLVALLVLLIAADMFGWPLTRSSAEALWQLAQKLLTVSATLLIGLLGARWARELVAEPAASPEKRAGQFTALGILGVAVTLALGVLLSNASLLLGVGVLAFLGGALWLGRGYLPDIVAGLQLRTQKPREVWFDGVAWQVTDVGFLTTQVCREGTIHTLQNRLVRDAQLLGTPAELSAR